MKKKSDDGARDLQFIQPEIKKHQAVGNDALQRRIFDAAFFQPSGTQTRKRQIPQTTEILKTFLTTQTAPK